MSLPQGNVSRVNTAYIASMVQRNYYFPKLTSAEITLKSTHVKNEHFLTIRIKFAVVGGSGARRFLCGR